MTGKVRGSKGFAISYQCLLRNRKAKNDMSKILKKLSFILVFMMIISGVQPSNVLATSKKYVKSLSVSKKTLSIRVGKSKSLSYKVKVKGKASKKITVKASNSNVKATIKDGKIHISAKKVGNSKITISTKTKNKKGQKIKKTIMVKILKKKTTTPAETPASAASTTDSKNMTIDDFLGVWSKENSGLSLYVVDDGTVYMGDLGNVKGNELMYENQNLYIGEIKGTEFYITQSAPSKFNKVETHTFQKSGDDLVDEEGVHWKYVKKSTRIVKDKGIY